MARRDLEAVAVGLQEALGEEYVAHRIRLVAYLGERMEKMGAVVSMPVGGSGVFVDVQAMYPHSHVDQLPFVALISDLYLEGGIRVGAHRSRGFRHINKHEVPAHFFAKFEPI
jgi:tryptophanase